MSAEDISQLCHLWRAAAFGPGPDDLRRSMSQGYDATVRELLAYDSVAETPPAPPPTTVLPPGVTLGLLEIAALIDWWIKVMVTTRRPLLEKMVLFWHGHFTTSADPVFSGGLLLRQNETLRSFATGRFEALLGAIAKDPGMLVYLDGMKNKKAHPNENFARELLELFTVGIGHYTEADVKAAARAFTGWTLGLPDAHFVFNVAEHDDGPKRFLGHIGSFTGEDILHLVAVHPETARHVCNRLFRYLAGSDPSAAELRRLCGIWQATHGTIGAVVKSILCGPEFRGMAAQRPGYRAPVEYLVAACRALRGHVNNFEFLDALRVMGQLPFLPPSVKGWEDGLAWINTSTLLDRVNLAHRLVSKLAEMPAFLNGMESLMGNAAPTAGVHSLLWTLGMADAAPSTARVLTEMWEESRHQGIKAAGPPLLELALASPDFQRR